MRGIDTNVLVRFIIEDDKKQAKFAEAYINDSYNADNPVFINRVVLCEVVWVLEKGYRYSRSEIAVFLENLFRTEEFVIEDSDAAWRALSDFKTKNIDFSDALIGHINKLHGCEETATFDKKAATLDEFVLLGK